MFIKTNVPAKIIRKGIMKAGGRYWCSEDHIQAQHSNFQNHQFLQLPLSHYRFFL